MNVDHACVLLKEIVIGLRLSATLVSSPLEGSYVVLDLSGLSDDQRMELEVVLTNYKHHQLDNNMVVT